jgi:hypothetical protein
VESFGISTGTAPTLIVAHLRFQSRRLFSIVEELAHRNFHRTSYLLKRFDSGNRMTILDAGYTTSGAGRCASRCRPGTGLRAARRDQTCPHLLPITIISSPVSSLCSRRFALDCRMLAHDNEQSRRLLQSGPYRGKLHKHIRQRLAWQPCRRGFW